jgi:PmbA protein
MTMSPEQARAIAQRAVELTPADEAEALVHSETSALTRFANNRINQNVAEDNAVVSVRAVMGTRIGVASSNRLDNDSLAAMCAAAVEAARNANEDPLFPGLPTPEPVETPDRSSASTHEFDANARATSVASIVTPSIERGLSAAGKILAAERCTAVANSKGIDVGMSTAGVEATVLSMANGQGSGWASAVGRHAVDIRGAELGEEAASVAQRSADPVELEAGEYPVVLGPEAVGTIVDFLSYTGFSAKALVEGRSFMSGHVNEGVVSELVTIVDDAQHDDAMGLTFDYEGFPRRRVPIIENGIARRPVTDSYWASRTEWGNSGHALPAPNSYGPLPLNLAMEPGGATLEELIGSVERGVYVTRFHYVNVEDPVTVLLTGMTRDGTFLIENGKITRPVKNLRFTQGVIRALWECSGVTAERKLVGSESSATLAPAILLDRFAFTGQTT